MERYIFAIIIFIIVCLFAGFPFYLIFWGFVYAATNKFWLGVVMIGIGLLFLRLIKPISIIMGKDYKIF